MSDEPKLTLNLKQSDFENIKHKEVSGLKNGVKPKEMVIKFAQATKDPVETDYTFEIRGSMKDAENYIHRMRTELSRFRRKISEMGRKPNHFQMYKKEIDCIDMICKITLTRNPELEVSKELQEAMDLFSTDEGV